MKRDEFLASLDAALATVTMSAETRSDVVREMESHIEELLARHGELAEEDVVAGLTPPDLLARALAEEFEGLRPSGSESVPRAAEGSQREGGGQEAGKRKPEGEEPGRGRRGRADSLGAAIQSLVDEAVADLESGLEDGARAMRDESRRLAREWGEKGRRFSRIHGEDFARGVREAVRSFAAWSPRDSGRYEGPLDIGDSRTLRLDFASADIQVRGGETAMLSIAIEGDEEDLDSWTPTARREGETLCVSEPRDARVRAQSIELEVPPSIDRLEIRSMSGDIRIGRLGVFAVVETKSGNVEVEGVRALALRSLSGDLSAREVAGDVGAVTASGDVEIEDVGGEVEATTTSGDIEACGIRGEARLESSSGDIELEAGREFPGGKVESVSGDVSVRLGNPGLVIRARTVSGEIDAPRTEGGERGSRRWLSRRDADEVDLALGSVSGDVSIVYE
jgi:hypothetical protein